MPYVNQWRRRHAFEPIRRRSANEKYTTTMSSNARTPSAVQTGR
jgi:hypothetical protein